jgi:hypothetical protein
MSTTTTSPNPGLYATIFTASNPDAATLQTYQAAASDIAGSGFTFVNLWFSPNGMHVDAAGNFRPTPAGNPAFISAGALTCGYSYVPQLLSTLTGSGSSVKTVRMTIGGWGCDGTFNCIVNLFNLYGTGPQNPLYANLLVLQELGVTGIDLDLEPGGNAPYFDYLYYIGPLTQLITMVDGLGMDVTFSPYQCEDFWLTLLASVFTQNGGKQPVTQMNLQCYAGNLQATWVAAMQAYAKLSMGLNTAAGAPFGISDPESFIVAGLGGTNMGVPVCPPVMQQQLTAEGFAVPGMTGAFIFDYGSIQKAQQDGTCAPNNTTKDYANALIAGINAVNGPV